MENNVNARVFEVKNYLQLSETEFAAQCGISSGTLHRARTGHELSSKTLYAIIKAFSVNKEWLFHGTGEMFLSEPKTAQPSPNSWKDAAFDALREQIEILKNQNRFMQELIIQKLGVNFNPGIAEMAGITDINIMGNSCNTVRVAQLAA